MLDVVGKNKNLSSSSSINNSDKMVELINRDSRSAFGMFNIKIYTNVAWDRKQQKNESSALFKIKKWERDS